MRQNNWQVDVVHEPHADTCLELSVGDTVHIGNCNLHEVRIRHIRRPSVSPADARLAPAHSFDFTSTISLSIGSSECNHVTGCEWLVEKQEHPPEEVRSDVPRRKTES